MRRAGFIGGQPARIPALLECFRTEPLALAFDNRFAK